MSHPFRADDEIGQLCGELSPWALQFATEIMLASRKAPRAERVAALARAFEIWPKICRRMPPLEAAAPVSAEAGYARDLDMQDIVARIAERRAEDAG